MYIDKSKIKSNIDLFRSLIDDSGLNADELDNTQAYVEKNPEELLKSFSLNLYQSLDIEKDRLVPEHYDYYKAFKERLFSTWELPLKRLDSLLYICTEIVNELREHMITPECQKTIKINITTRLHARCVQVGKEISCLLHGGYADGAFARWRTLHETSATTKFICEDDEDLAVRFVDFQSIMRLGTATQYNDHNELGFDSFSDEQLARFEREKKEIQDKYEPNFEKKFGWARKALGDSVKPTGNLTFADIEKFVELSFLRNHFSFASQYVHAGIDSIGYKLGTSMSNEDILLAGPSNEGFIEPIQCTSLSLIYATEALLKAYPNNVSSVRISVLWLWHEVLKQEVLDAAAALQAKGDAMRQNSSSVK
uniref:DUF5677 domain-containing protein n=1 Tax=Pseudomonas lundensis TaxID=86185 RepID=UPI0028D299AC|nr:DUF5677 domain-containing protein [Pseudomonas lundensis]